MTLRTLGLVLLIFALPGVAADIAAGEALHASECIACHKSLMGGEANTIYTREERRIHSYDSLLTQVRRCEVNLELQWFDEDVENVSAFLNSRFYHF